jgi:hypothetical protein
MSANKSRPAAPPAPPPAGRPVAEWMLLLSMSGISAWFNIQDNASKIATDLAVGAGIAPVLAAMLTSHIVAKHRNADIWVRVVTFAVMCGAMALSAQAIGDVVRPADKYLWWLFGPVTDAAELIALHMLLTHAAAGRAARKAAAQAAGEPAAGTTEAPASPSGPAGGTGPAEPPRRSAPRGIDRSAEAEAARKMYRKSKAAGTPLSDRKLAAEFGRSRTWGTNRIREVEESPLGIARTGTDHD